MCEGVGACVGGRACVCVLCISTHTNSLPAHTDMFDRFFCIVSVVVSVK